jgi:hypothetical protein
MAKDKVWAEIEEFMGVYFSKVFCEELSEEC